jgi:exodeoxyribonuclease-5
MNNQDIIQDRKQIRRDILSSSFKFTESQIKAIKKIIKFIINKDEQIYGLYGYAGTGKTTTIVEIIFNLIKHKHIKSVVLTASTHKATNVLKNKFIPKLIELYNHFYPNNKDNNLDDYEIYSKLLEKDIKIDFTTIHKLLNYKTDYTNSGEMIFIRDTKQVDKQDNILDTYDIIIIDECSMLSTGLLNEIINEVINNRKIILSGDDCQLNPVNETTSPIFYTDITLNEYKKNINQDHLSKDYDDLILKNNYDKFKNVIKNIHHTTLTDIVRSNFDDVIGICTEIRSWINSNKTFPDMSKYNIDKNVFFFEYNTNTNKFNNEWFNKFIKSIKKDDFNIILTWTNNQANNYNREIRKLIFNKKVINKYEIGDILVFNDFYYFNDKFHTSEQVKIIAINKLSLQLKPFTPELSKQALKIKSLSYFQDKYAGIIDYINNFIQKEYKCYKLDVIDTNSKLDKEQTKKHIYILDETEQQIYNNNKEYITNMIRKLREDMIKNNFGLISIDKYIIQPLWREYHDNYINPFANVTYGYAMTVHKAQGSNFHNVYVDVDDILSNKNVIEMKKCLYTAVTRTVNELNILI